MNNQKKYIFKVSIVKFVEIKAQNIVCSSPNGGAEGFTINNNSFTDDDWK